MKFEKMYDIKEWARWDAFVFDSVKNFSETFSCKPNILQANEHTFAQIDFLTNISSGQKKNVIDTRTGNKAGEEDEVKLDGFECELASIDFSCDNELADNEFRLIYDDEPEWDEPEKEDNVPEDELQVIQSLFHDLIRHRAGKIIDRNKDNPIEFPVLTMELLSQKEQGFPIQGMFGGFYYRLLMENNRLKLIVNSWSRVVDGSGQKHEITKDGCVLTESGFV
jgi:hypothetical protein